MSTIFAYFDSKVPIKNNILAQMLSASDYWKPDSTSQKINNNGQCHIAKASLFNTELSRLDNVYQNPETGSIISANARIDNRAELIKKLSLDAELSSQLTDSEFILHAYQYWGEDCPKHLLGDFVFIIWDEVKKRVFCARDHFGVKVLYYAPSSNGIMISNEHNAFFTTNRVKKQVKESWLIRHLWGQGPEPVESPYHGIEVLPPAHSLSVDSDGSISIIRYWELKDNNEWQNWDDESLIAELKKRFQHAVKIRLDSTYPLAAELSEGLDSNGIVGFAAQMLDTPPLYTLSYNCEELTDINRKVWEKTYQDIFEMLDMHDNLKPVWTSSQNDTQQEKDLLEFHQYIGGVMGINGGHFQHSRLAQQQGARVLLSGWGGDHCVSTYGDFFESELFRRGKWLCLHQHFRGKHKRNRSAKPVKAWLQLLIKHFSPKLYRKLVRQRGGLEKAMWQRAALSPLKQEYLNRYDCKKRLQQFTDSYQRYSVKAHHRRELFDVGVEGRLVESELCGRMYRIEYRYPMLDVPLVELAYNMPSHLKIHHGLERYMFRRILEGVTTERIQWRVKADVQHPQFDYEQKQRVEELNKQLLGSKLAQTYCDPSRLRNLAKKESSFFAIRNYKLLLDLERQKKLLVRLPTLKKGG
ncbi:MAG: asparagine synthase-related protein [Mariprofundales bacterium]